MRWRPEPMRPNARQKRWVTDLLTRHDAIEHAIGAPIGELLGCGHWGCVFASVPPWVVKVSIDPTEGPIWATIKGLVDTESWGTQGFTEVKDILRISPDLVVGGRKRRVWVIIREGIIPVFEEHRRKGLQFSAYTAEVLGVPPDTYPYGRLSGPHATDWEHAIKALQQYRAAATAWHLMDERRTAERARQLDYYRVSYNIGSKDDAESRALRALDWLGGPHFGPLGESLQMLAANGIYLRDVHLLNIGWHQPTDPDDDWARVVIFDPGHTPTKGTSESIAEADVSAREAL